MWKIGKLWRTADNLDFMEWDQLMPVVEKAEQMGYTFYIFAGHFKFWENYLADKNREPATIDVWHGNMEDFPKLGVVYDGMVQFVKWFNNEEARRKEGD